MSIKKDSAVSESKRVETHENFNSLPSHEYRLGEKLTLGSMILETVNPGGSLGFSVAPVPSHMIMDGISGQAVWSWPRDHFGVNGQLHITLVPTGIWKVRFAYYAVFFEGCRTCDFIDQHGMKVKSIELPDQGHLWCECEVPSGGAQSISKIQLSFGTDIQSGTRVIDSFTLWH